MSPFDVFIVCILGFCVVRGLFRGLIKEVSAIIGVMTGFYAAYTYYPVLSDSISSWVSTSAYAMILSFLLIFCGVFILVSLLGAVIKYLLSITFLGWVDRVCGVAFGLLKGVLICSVLLIAFTTFLPKGSPVVEESVLSPYITSVSETMVMFVPKDMKRQFSDKMRSVKNVWQREKGETLADE